MSEAKGSQIKEVVNLLEELGLAPEEGVNLLISTLFMVLLTNNYSRIEMCRRVNEAFMSVSEEVTKESLQ